MSECKTCLELHALLCEACDKLDEVELGAYYVEMPKNLEKWWAPIREIRNKKKQIESLKAQIAALEARLPG